MKARNPLEAWNGQLATYMIDRFRRVDGPEGQTMTRRHWEIDFPYHVRIPSEEDRKKITLLWFRENVNHPWGMFRGEDSFHYFAFHDADDAIQFRLTWT